MNVEKLQKMAGTVRTGGKGTVRRKKKAVHKTTSTDEKKLQTQLKRLGVNVISGIEEVLLFNEDNSALSFTQPKVQASIVANTYVVSGTPQLKSPQEAMASMFNSQSLQQLMAQMGMSGGLPGMGAMGGDDEEEDDDDDDDVPELVGNFDQPE
jgi:nascent polypeptide-associated complex subunit beta